MLSTKAMSSASRTGFHSGPSAQSTLAISVFVCARNIPAASIGLQLHPCPVAWCSSMLTVRIPRDSPHCANSSAARISSPWARGSPCGEAKLKRSTGSTMSSLRLRVGRRRRRPQERGKIREQSAVDDLDAGAERVDVVSEQRQIRWRNVGGRLEGKAVGLQCLRGLGEVVDEVAQVVHRVAGCSRPGTFRHLLDEFYVWALQRIDESRGGFAGSVHSAN